MSGSRTFKFLFLKATVTKHSGEFVAVNASQEEETAPSKDNEVVETTTVKDDLTLTEGEPTSYYYI